MLRLSSLGDVVLSSSFLRSLQALFPEAAIDFVVRSDLQVVAQALPAVTRVVPVARHSSLRELLRQARQLAATQYDHVFDLHRSLRSRILVLHLRHRLRGGFDKQSLARWLLIHTHRDYYAKLGGTRTMRQRMLQPLERMGLQPTLLPTQLLLSPAAQMAAQKHLTEDAAADADSTLQWIALAPGALWPSKQWPREHYLALAEQLLEKASHRLVLVGGERERQLCEAIAVALPSPVQNLAGQLDILQTAAILQRCRFAVVNDSGLLHIAEAVGCPVVALFGPTSPRFGYAPHLPSSQLLYRPPDCSPCSKNGSRPCHRPTQECMLRIDTAEVLQATERVVEPEHTAPQR